jgi:hypothetical protein
MRAPLELTTSRPGTEHGTRGLVARGPPDSRAERSAESLRMPLAGSGIIGAFWRTGDAISMASVDCPKFRA